MGWVVTSWRAVPPAGTWQAEGWGPHSMGLLAGQDNALWPHMLQHAPTCWDERGAASSSPTTN